MKFREKLIPVSYHLRNFNNYIALNIDASKNGNLTLIGENTAGKTTLANCFFPMLIDGSIATPSFNPAKDSGKLDNIKKTRNNSNDSRTFETMLLGWGTGSMKVRTGYSYMLMKSNKRQAIVGIGAHRAVGAKSGPTWWFVILSNNPENNLNFSAVDDTGKSLDKNEFIRRNESLGNNFQVFTSVTDFQSFVSDKIYGFSDPHNLNHLASTYRLLASPILTAGSGKLTPILESMKNAQEGIDNQIIDSVAETQREVNRKNFTNQRIEQAQKRLTKLKKEIFWRNLNQMQRLFVNPYGKDEQTLERYKAKQENYQKLYNDYFNQLEQLTPLIKQAEQQVVTLKERKIKQDTIKEQQRDKQNQIDLLQKEIDRYAELKSRLDEQKQQLDELEQIQYRVKGSFKSVEGQLKSLFTDLKADNQSLTNLNELLNENNYSGFYVLFKNYLIKIQQALTKYLSIKNSQENLNTDIQIVTSMRKNMDIKIDLRTKGVMFSRIRDGLIQDNLDVHKDGAAQMSSNYDALDRQCQTLLEKNIDLKVFLNQKELLETLKTMSDQCQQLMDQFNEAQKELEQQRIKVQNKQLDIQTVEQDLKNNYPNYDIEEQKSILEKYQIQLKNLVIDTNLNYKLVSAQETLTKYQSQQQVLANQKISSKAGSDGLDEPISNLKDVLTELAQSCNDNLNHLSPYISPKIELKNIDQLLEFIHQHGSVVKNNNFGDLSERIGRIIHNNTSNTFDKYALDDTFEDRGHGDIASAMRQQNSIDKENVRVLSFDVNKALKLITEDGKAIRKSLTQLESGNMIAQQAYLLAAAHQISDQYSMVDKYNEMLSHGSKNNLEIRLKVSLQPTMVAQEVIDEARDTTIDQRTKLLEEVQHRLNKLASDTSIIEDNFNDEARRLLDIRQWSEFKIWIHRKHSAINHFEEVDDKFVQSGGSGAEKAQAMVLPLLLVPKMILNRSRLTDAPALVMFDEFADKLDHETAKSFAKTIDQFGFNFLATMPGGAQNKILADGVENIAYDVISPKNKDDGKFHCNSVRIALTWHGEKNE